MSFWISDWFDETDVDDGIYFSNDAGENFNKVFDFDFSNTANNTYLEYIINISDLANLNSIELTENFVVRFQQRGENDFSGASNVAGDGLFLDNINISELTTSASSVPNKNLIKIYPTPSIDEINIDFTRLNQKVEDIEFYNHLGNILLSKKVKNQNSNHEFDLSGFPSGIYFLSVKLSNGNLITKKVLKI